MIREGAGPEKHVILGWILEFIKPDEKEVIVELGCSNGYYIGNLLYKDNPKQILTLGVDLKVDTLIAGRKKYSMPYFLCSDVQHLSLKNESASKLLCVETLEHVPDDRAAVKEIGRVLKKGGKAFITVPNKNAR